MAVGDKGIGWPIHVYKLIQNYFGGNHRANMKSNSGKDAQESHKSKND